MKLTVKLTCLFFILTVTFYGQTHEDDLQKKIKKADSLASQNKYEDAINLFETILKEDVKTDRKTKAILYNKLSLANTFNVKFEKIGYFNLVVC